MRRLINFLQSRFSGFNTQDIFRPSQIITVGPSNCDFLDLSDALQNSLPGQQFFIYGGEYTGPFNLKDKQIFHLFNNPVFIAPSNSPLFYALYHNNNENVTVNFIGRGSFLFSSPDIISDLHPMVVNFQIHIDLFIQCTISQSSDDAPLVDIINSNVYYHNPGFANRIEQGIYSLALLPVNSLSVETSVAIEGSDKLPFVNRQVNPHYFTLRVYDREMNLSDNFLIDLTISTKSIAVFT